MRGRFHLASVGQGVNASSANSLNHDTIGGLPTSPCSPSAKVQPPMSRATRSFVRSTTQREPSQANSWASQRDSFSEVRCPHTRFATIRSFHRSGSHRMSR